MAVAGGPNLSENGLVFYYDTDNGKSYKGEPTTNLNTLTLSDSGTDGSGQGSVGTRTILSPNHVRIVDVNSNTRQSHLIQGLTGGTTYTISIEYKKLSGAPTFRFQIQDYNGGSFLTLIKFTNTAETGLVDVEGWQTASWTFTLGADANAVRIWYQDGADYTTYTHSFELRNPQLEAKSHPTPYTAPGTTRSATESLYDFISDSALDVSNVSFDSNADITFDGTNDHISFSNNLLVPGVALEGTISELTIDAWVNWNTFAPSGNYDEIISWWKGGTQTYLDGFLGASKTGGFSSTNPGLRFGDGWTNTGVSFTAATDVNKWWNIVAIKTATDAYIYVNGELRATKGSPLSWGFNDYPSIGRHPNYVEWLDGKIGALKLYNQALTAEEVQRNFNGIRSRFGI